MNLITRAHGFDDFFDDFIKGTPEPPVKCDIYEEKGNYHIVMDAPGFQKENINVEVKNGNIIISAETKNETSDEDKNYIKRERHYGKFSRSFYVGDDVNSDNIKASFKDGVLTVEVPKPEQIENSKIIEIEG